MKKYVLFLTVYIVAYMVLHVCSGMLITLLNTPGLSLDDASSGSSQIEFGGMNLIMSLGISLLTLGIAFGVTKLVFRRNVNKS